MTVITGTFYQEQPAWGENGNCSRIVIAKTPTRGRKHNVCVRNPDHYPALPSLSSPISLHAPRHGSPASILNARLLKSAHPSATWGWLQPWIPPIGTIISQHTRSCARHSCNYCISIKYIRFFFFIFIQWRIVWYTCVQYCLWASSPLSSFFSYA